MPNDCTKSNSPIPAPPLFKRRKLDLLSTLRVRNGGDITSFLTPAALIPSSTLPPPDDADLGSETEDEADEETAQYYLNKMTDDTDRKIETVFGEGVKVWKSIGGTVYADLTDREKRKMREKELWDQEAKEKIEGGLKRKIAAEAKTDEELVEEVKTEERAAKKFIFKPKRNYDPKTNVFARLHNEDISFHKTPPAPIPSPKSPYPPRDPNTTQFHHSSAGIDPLGAHNRPIMPLPTRRRNAVPNVPEGNFTTLHAMPSNRSRAEGPQVHGANRLLPSRAPSLPARSERIVSGSFGSFEGGMVNRFEERGYRLLPASRREEGGRSTGQGGEKVLDVFKGRPWLRG
ncbi:hypothetical protein BDU57DRAFT_49891 [Ampelomyces quisqualis]|uniref:Uncharacterized protein n=1 Tax=Ampelomyces quisqualis TaxID=50730 RepID=A0A6A5R2Q7_AMPQU|nr:hypothetical protein BDU57DRAFT_49891 [Ampelomyces quisqualis]